MSSTKIIFYENVNGKSKVYNRNCFLNQKNHSKPLKREDDTTVRQKQGEYEGTAQLEYAI